MSCRCPYLKFEDVDSMKPRGAKVPDRIVVLHHAEYNYSSALSVVGRAPTCTMGELIQYLTNGCERLPGPPCEERLGLPGRRRTGST